MRGRWSLAVVVTVSLFLVGSSTWTEGTDGKTAVKGKGMAQVMREFGFDYESAQWTGQTTQTEDTGKVTKTMSQVWISGNKMRVEIKDRETGEILVLIDDGQNAYIYNPKEKTATEMGPMMRGVFAGFADSEAFKQAAERRKTAKKVGSETVNGKPCTIYAYQQSFGGLTSDVKEWVWNGKNFSMKTVVSTPKQTLNMMGIKSTVPASTTESLVTDLALNKDAPASLFHLPAGVKVEGMEMKTRGADDEAAEEALKEIPKGVQEMLKKLF